MHKYLRLLFSSLCLALVSGPATATIVRLDIAIGSQAPQAVYIELFDLEAPATVTNFLNYVDDGAGERRYDNTFIHRLSAGFVIQLGGYAFDPSLGDFEGAGVSHIPEDAPVINEFSADRSNIRGTIAMAQFGTDPNSATSEWFFNLADNSANLDDQNGGFTVFGRVLGTGMETIDEIATLEIQDASFPALPVVDYTPGATITVANLVTLNQAVENPPAAINLDNSNPDFGRTEIGVGPDTRIITIQNIGATDLIMGTVGNTDSLSAPFAFNTDNCSGLTLASLQSCTITVEFEPTLPEDAQDSFNVPSSDSDSPDLVVTLSGSGVSSTPVLDVTPSDTIELGTVLVGSTKSLDIVVRNAGGTQLMPGIPSISGTDADAFTITQDNCLGVSLSLDATCTITVEISGNSEGIKTAIFQISAAPGNQTFQATLSGSVIPLVPDIDIIDPINVGDALIGEVLNSGFGIRNLGIDPLTVTSIEIIGADASLFTLGGICTGGEINPGFGCGETLAFEPVIAMDSVDATARVSSNDPDTPVLEVTINASASRDKDGITDAIENQAPNGGDGNNDGIADSIQPHVSSLPNINGDYITIETSASQTLVDINALENPSPGNTPVTSGSNTLDFSQGFFAFTIEDVPASGLATVTIHLPENIPANIYFKYGPTPTSPFFSSWYLFNFDGQTGAEFFDDRIVLHFVDGGRGDSDLTVNGRIVDPGGPATFSSSSASTSSGGGGGCSLQATGYQLRQTAWPIDFIALVTGLLLFRWYRTRYTITPVSPAPRSSR